MNILNISASAPETLVKRVAAYAKRQKITKAEATRRLVTFALDADLAERKARAAGVGEPE